LIAVSAMHITYLMMLISHLQRGMDRW